MSININKVIIQGRLGQTPELKETNSGTNICNLSVATSDKRAGKETTEWHKVICFAKTAETAAQYLEQGQEVMVEGRIQYRSWEDNQGQKKYTTEIVADRVQFGPKKQSSQQAQEEETDVPF